MTKSGNNLYRTIQKELEDENDKRRSKYIYHTLYTLYDLENWKGRLQMNVLRKLFHVTVNEPRTDADGVEFQHVEGEYQGNDVELNISEYGYHARANKDSKTTQHSMDENGLVSWFKSLIKR